jgi:protein SCO1/2
MQLKGFVNLLIPMALLSGCMAGIEKKTSFPILGGEEILVEDSEGQDAIDTIYPNLRNFEFVNQDGELVTGETYDGYIYIADYFFTSCPTICPKMTANMLLLYQEFEDEVRVRVLSHSIDTRHDSVPVLKRYAGKLDVEAPKWNFVTGSMSDLQEMAKKYMVNAMEDETAAGGYLHSGHFVLVDPEGHIRCYYDGTVPEDIDQIIFDINLLLDQSYGSR